MKRLILILFTLYVSLLTFSQAPKWQKKVRSIQLTVYTWDKSGQMHESQGIWLDANGRAVTDYDVMKGAVKATVTDTKGKEYAVETIDGASSLYNIAVLKTSAGKTTCLPTGAETPVQNATIWIMPNSRADASVPATADTIGKVDHFLDTYTYLTLTGTGITDRQISCPALSDEGNLLGLVQPASKAGQPACVIDLRFAEQLHIGAMDASKSDYRDIRITKTLPEGADAAQSFIYLTGMQDTVQYLALADQYIRNYPASSVGYTIKAEALCASGRYAEADELYKKALSIKNIPLDEVLYSRAKMMYQAAAKNPNPYPTWTLETALADADKAYAFKSIPLYLNMKAFCQFGLKQYAEAEKTFLDLSKTNMRSAENYLYVAQCRQMQNDSIQAIIEMQDSALACYTKPYPQAAAPVILMRALSYTDANMPRKAVLDYNEYEHLVGSDGLTYLFYYQREQLELQCRMYTAALNDIERAIKKKNDEPILYAELASLNYRVNLLDDATVAEKKAIEIDPKFADAYRILAVILRQQNKTAESRTALQKAAELGDEKAKEMLNE